ncbi:hypothetical protein LEMLEM_LOCUS23546 [Lemmus lemmus]
MMSKRAYYDSDPQLLAVIPKSPKKMMGHGKIHLDCGKADYWERLSQCCTCC